MLQSLLIAISEFCADMGKLAYVADQPRNGPKAFGRLRKAANADSSTACGAE